jgi:hypothetical protein
MIVWKEKQQLDEMAICVVSSLKELLFRVAIKTPDHLPPHAHVMDLKTGKVELGQFLISSSLPQKPEDIKDYKQGISDEMRLAIFKWAGAHHEVMKMAKNWEFLWGVWKMNEVK